MSSLLPVRKHNRLRSFDYRTGWYFVTMCSAKRAPVFGAPEGARVAASNLGSLVSRCWYELEELQTGCSVDQFALMPDHLHGIEALESDRHTLGSIVGTFKSRVSRLARQEGLIGSETLWQRSFHDRIIRNERELASFRRYIAENALALHVPPRIRAR